MNVLGKAAHTRHTPFKLAEGEVKIRTHLNPAQQTSAGRSSGGCRHGLGGREAEGPGHEAEGEKGTGGTHGGLKNSGCERVRLMGASSRS